VLLSRKRAPPPVVLRVTGTILVFAVSAAMDADNTAEPLIRAARPSLADAKPVFDDSFEDWMSVAMDEARAVEMLKSIEGVE
jgi:hypothetical protein